jgi:hypothetical protein
MKVLHLEVEVEMKMDMEASISLMICLIRWSLGQQYGPLDSAEKRRNQLPQVIHYLNTNVVLMLA